MAEHPIILFDGQCLLCTRAVPFVHRRDKGFVFRFAALQSEQGRALLQAYGLRGQMDSMVVLDGDRALTASDAMLFIAGRLGWPWRLARGLTILPKRVRDAAYFWFARNRYRWWGKTDKCYLPDERYQARFKLA